MIAWGSGRHGGYAFSVARSNGVVGKDITPYHYLSEKMPGSSKIADKRGNKKCKTGEVISLLENLSVFLQTL